MLALFRKPKTFKLRALHSQRKFGVAGKSCQEVLRKGCLHLQLPVPGSRLCLYEDGTELTGDYFWSIPNNSELVLLTEGQTWQGCKWWDRGECQGSRQGCAGGQGNRSGRHVSKDVIQMVNKMLGVSEIYPMPRGWDVLVRLWRNWNLHALLAGCKTVQLLWGAVWGFFKL